MCPEIYVYLSKFRFVVSIDTAYKEESLIVPLFW